MTIGVLGAGAVGGTIAATLAAAGHRVDVTARGEHLRTIQEDGLEFRTEDRVERVRVAAAERLSRPVDAVFVCTKIHDTADALAQNAGLLRGIPVILVQNGLGAIERADEILPASDVMGASAMFAASLTGPGRVEMTEGGDVLVGRGRGAPSERARQIATMLTAAGLPARAVSNYEGVTWTKLVVNCVNALPAVTGLPVQLVAKDRALLTIMTESMRETVAVGRAQYVRFGSIGPVTKTAILFLRFAPLRLALRVPRAIVKGMGERPNPGSTLQSIRRQRPTEIDRLNGETVRLGQELDVPTPVNHALVELVHRVEKNRRFLTPREITAAIAKARENA